MSPEPEPRRDLERRGRGEVEPSQPRVLTQTTIKMKEADAAGEYLMDCVVHLANHMDAKGPVDSRTYAQLDAIKAAVASGGIHLIERDLRGHEVYDQ